MIRVEVQNIDAVRVNLDSVPAAVMAALHTKIKSLTINLANYVQTQKLQGQVLMHKSGALERSIQSNTEASGSLVTGKVFSAGDVKYAAIHEYGGVIPAHDIVARNASALAFVINGKTVFAKSVHIPEIVMPERSFLRSSLTENKEHIIEGIGSAAVDAAKKAAGK
jgi:phage gpG-like protein